MSLRRSLLAITFAILALITFVGCLGGKAGVTSGKIGCSAGDITITDEDEGWNTSSWVATCHGRRFFCSYAKTSKYSADFSCSPEVASE